MNRKDRLWREHKGIFTEDLQVPNMSNYAWLCDDEGEEISTKVLWYWDAQNNIWEYFTLVMNTWAVSSTPPDELRMQVLLGTTS